MKAEPGTVIATYTRAAAQEVVSRGGQAGTIYALTWPHVKPYAGRYAGGRRHGSAYQTRAIAHGADPALEEYEQGAPSLQARSDLDDAADALLNWDGKGKPPLDLEELVPSGALRYILPVARWMADGAPLTERAYIAGIIDEVQDVRPLEYAAFEACVSGPIDSYGDPGQAIYQGDDTAIPYAWRRADSSVVLDGGHRVGDPVATVAAHILSPYWDRGPAAFRAEHETELLVWDGSSPPLEGLVLGHSRGSVSKKMRDWVLADVPVVAGIDGALRLSTIHSAKGAEADDVFLLPWPPKHMAALRRHEPWALRLLYVACTRAKRRLHVPMALMLGMIG